LQPGCSEKGVVVTGGANYLRENVFTKEGVSAGLAVRGGDIRAPIKLWQGCGKNPDLAAKTDIIDNSLLKQISNLHACNALRLHPAYRLIRHFCI
jgi:hypothetical protein